MSTLQNEIGQAAHWIAEYVREAGASKVVVGLSGGIDSALAAALAVQGLGADNVIGVAMPCHSNPADLIDARLVADHLGIEFLIEDLSDEFDAKKRMLSKEQIQALPTKEERELARLRMANIKARMRMITLYDVGAEHGAFVLGTCNKSEVQIGYETKYGDGGYDINPTANFFKTEVWEMARILGLPDRIIDRIPSAGLWDDQTDMGELGLDSYEELDGILGVLEHGNPTRDFDPDHIDKVQRLQRISAHKRHMPPCFARRFLDA